MKHLDDSLFVSIVNSSLSMREASIKLNLHYNTFIRYAKKLGVYKPNQGGKGKSKPKEKIPLLEILNGLHPTYQTFKLKHRLYAEKIKENRCEKCNLTSWLGESIQCELDHIDGNSSNHLLSNLRILCPNCHSQTSTFRSKNRK